jgi:hypothetical protein
METTCKKCGGPAILGMDPNSVCPECRRLDDFWGDMGIGQGDRGDHQQEIGEGCYRTAPTKTH